jgi:hypothetical protein
MRDAPGGAFGDGLSFSAGQKTGYSFLNLLYGTGSFLMGDISGGLWVGGMELTGTVLIIVGIVNIGGATTTSGYYYYGNYYSESYVDSGKLTAGYIMLGVGALLEIGGAIYGFIRPSSYDRTLSGRQGTYNSFNGNPIRNIDIGVLPDDRGIRKLNLTWSSSF